MVSANMAEENAKQASVIKEQEERLLSEKSALQQLSGSESSLCRAASVCDLKSWPHDCLRVIVRWYNENSLKLEAN